MSRHIPVRTDLSGSTILSAFFFVYILSQFAVPFKVRKRVCAHTMILRLTRKWKGLEQYLLQLRLTQLSTLHHNLLEEYLVNNDVVPRKKPQLFSLRSMRIVLLILEGS